MKVNIQMEVNDSVDRNELQRIINSTAAYCVIHAIDNAICKEEILTREKYLEIMERFSEVDLSHLD